jgi:predicted RecA/RadA family phage recombinase
MTIRVDEAFLVGSIDQHEQITVNNSDEGTDIVKGEVFHVHTADGYVVGMVAQGDIDDGEDGEGCIKGEFSFKKRAGETFAALDQIYWARGHNEAIHRSDAKAGDFFIAECTLESTSTDTYVRGRVGEPKDNLSLSVSTSISSTSTSSTSHSSRSTSVSVSSSSYSSASTSSESSDSSSSTSVSSNSDESTSSNSDSSTSSESV